MRRMNNKVLEQIESLCRENGLSIDSLTEELKSLSEKKKYERNLKSVEDSKSLVGRCYKGYRLEGVSLTNGVIPTLGKDPIFCKVVSERADRIGEVECITFSQAPEVSFRAETHMLWQPTDGIVGHFQYKGIHNCSIDKHRIEKLTEITSEEFEAAAQEHLNKLLDIDWRAIAGPIMVREFDDER